MTQLWVTITVKTWTTGMFSLHNKFIMVFIMVYMIDRLPDTQHGHGTMMAWWDKSVGHRARMVSVFALAT